MSKQKTLSAEQVTQYFQRAATFSPKERIHWLRGIVETLVLANELERAKEGKRFKYDFEKHKIIMGAIEALLPAEEKRDFSRGLVPFLKESNNTLRAAAILNLIELMQTYANNVLYEKENSLWDNPVAGNAEFLQEIGSLPTLDDQGFMAARKAAYAAACERLYKTCEAITHEVEAGISGIRAAWLGDLFANYSKAIVYVYGDWRFSQLLHQLMTKDFRFTRDDAAKNPQNEKEKLMLTELMLVSGQITEKDLNTGAAEQAGHDEHSCECGHDEHEGCCHDAE